MIFMVCLLFFKENINYMIKTFQDFVNENSQMELKKNVDYDDYTVLDDMLDKLDFSHIPKGSAKRQYVNFKLVKRMPTYGDLLFDTSKSRRLSESVGTYDIEQVREEIMCSYALEDWQFVIKKGCNDIKVAIVIPNIDENDEMIKSDIESFGYYESNRDERMIDGKRYLIIQFNPRYPGSINNTVRTMSCILHISPKYNLESIKENGFIPQHRNERFSYPDRIHFLRGSVTENEIVNIGQQLCDSNNNPLNTGEYVLFTLSVSKIPKDVDFIGDACYELGICTEDRIPYDAVISTKEYFFFK